MSPVRSGNDAALFDIDSMTGQLETVETTELDYDVTPLTSYMVMVTVTDGRDAENNVDATVRRHNHGHY